MVLDITANIVDLRKEKDAYFKSDDKSVLTKYTKDENVYAIQGPISREVSLIDEKLRELNPLDADAASVVQSDAMSQGGGFKLTAKNLPQMLGDKSAGYDVQSNFSIPVSGISRRSNFTTITLSS